MTRDELKAIIAKIERIEIAYNKRFARPDGWPGVFIGTGRFNDTYNALRELEDWELDDPKNVGDIIMEHLYTETEFHNEDETDDEEFMNVKIRRLMVAEKLYRKADKKRWNI